MIRADPTCLRQAFCDERIGRTAERLLTAYRNELLGALKACIEACLRDGTSEIGCLNQPL